MTTTQILLLIITALAVINAFGWRAAYKKSKKTEEPPTPEEEPKKQLSYVHKDKCVVGTVNYNTMLLKYRINHNESPLEVYRTANGSMIINSYYPSTRSWLFRLPTREEQELYANVMKDKEDLIEY